MTELQHISAVRAIIANGPASDDLSYSDRVISHFLQITRAFLIERKADKYRYISDQSFQSVCLELELGSFHNCCDTPDIECYILKSTIKIPKLLNSKWGSFIKVMDLAGNIIPEFNLTNNKYAQYGLIPPTIGWFPHDGYIYVINNKQLVKILVNGLYVNPTEVLEINCVNGVGTNCNDFASAEFPIDSDLIDPMYKATLEYLLQSERIPNDIENNARATETTNGKQ